MDTRAMVERVLRQAEREIRAANPGRSGHWRRKEALRLAEGRLKDLGAASDVEAVLGSLGVRATVELGLIALKL